MTPIYPAQIDHPMAWRGSDISKEDIAFDLTKQQVGALEEILRKLRKLGLQLGEIRAAHCRHPALDSRNLPRLIRWWHGSRSPSTMQQARGTFGIRSCFTDSTARNMQMQFEIC